MGFWNDGIRTDSPTRHRSRSGSRERSPSRSQSRRHSSKGNNYNYYWTRPANNRSVSSFSNLFGGSSAAASRGRSYSSRARPRSGFVAKIRKFLRDLYSYMRRHPVKVFLLVIMPLITGGALTKILAQVGIRLPPSLERMVGGGLGQRTMTESQRYYARGGARDFEGGTALPGMGGGIGSSIQGALGIAKMFL